MCVENEEDVEPWYRRFALVRLTAQQLAEEVHSHERFHAHVGKHTDYDDDGHRTPGAVLPKDGWAIFYDEYKKWTRPDYSVNTILGWFEV